MVREQLEGEVDPQDQQYQLSLWPDNISEFKKEGGHADMTEERKDMVLGNNNSINTHAPPKRRDDSQRKIVDNVAENLN